MECMDHVGNITQKKEGLHPLEPLLHPPRPDGLGIITQIG